MVIYLPQQSSDEAPLLDELTPVYSNTPKLGPSVTLVLLPSGPFVLALLIVAIEREPAFTVKPPLNVLAPERINVPLDLVRPPLPAMTPLSARLLLI